MVIDCIMQIISKIYMEVQKFFSIWNKKLKIAELIELIQSHYLSSLEFTEQLLCKKITTFFNIGVNGFHYLMYFPPCDLCSALLTMIMLTKQNFICFFLGMESC